MTPVRTSNYWGSAAGGRICVQPVGDLTPKQIHAWSAILYENTDLSSPFFAPDYALAVGAVVPDVRVGIMEHMGEPVAFLPFERNRYGVGCRLRLCDYQGLIAKQRLDFDAWAFIKGCGLKSWDFDHLLASQAAFRPFHRGFRESPIIDLSNGFDAYVLDRRAAGTEQIKKAGNLMRRLEREVGPLRFESHLQDPVILRQLLAWRSIKYAKSRHPVELITDILERLLARQSSACQGVLSVLFAGDEIAAAHFGLRSAQTWHYWFPAYNPCLEKYSPGTILLLQMTEFAPKIGIRTIDLGKGDQDYKRRLMNGSNTLAEGSVEVEPLLRGVRSVRGSVQAWLRNHPRLASPIRQAIRLTRHAKWVSQNP